MRKMEDMTWWVISLGRLYASMHGMFNKQKIGV